MGSNPIGSTISARCVSSSAGPVVWTSLKDEERFDSDAEGKHT